MAKRKTKLGTDFHGVIAADVPLLWQTINKAHLGTYKSLNDIDVGGLPSPVLYPERYPNILESRRKLFTDPEHLRYISPAAGIFLGLPLLARVNKSPLYMITAMQESMREGLEDLLERWDLAPYFLSLCLRQDVNESPVTAKVFNALKAGVTHMIEDDPALTVAFVQAGIKVIHLVDGKGEVGIPNSLNVIRYKLLYDFAIDAGLAGSVEGVFEKRQDELKDPENAFKIFEHEEISCTDEAFLCGNRGVFS